MKTKEAKARQYDWAISLVKEKVETKEGKRRRAVDQRWCWCFCARKKNGVEWEIDRGDRIGCRLYEWWQCIQTATLSVSLHVWAIIDGRKGARVYQQGCGGWGWKGENMRQGMGTTRAREKLGNHTDALFFLLGYLDVLFGCMKWCGVMKGGYFLFVWSVSWLGLLSCRHGMHWYERKVAIGREKKRSMMSKGAWAMGDTRGREHDPMQARVLGWMNGLRDRRKQSQRLQQLQRESGNNNGSHSNNTRKARERERERYCSWIGTSAKHFFFSVFVAFLLDQVFAPFSPSLSLPSSLPFLYPFLDATIFHTPRPLLTLSYLTFNPHTYSYAHLLLRASAHISSISLSSVGVYICVYTEHPWFFLSVFFTSLSPQLHPFLLYRVHNQQSTKNPSASLSCAFHLFVSRCVSLPFVLCVERS